MISSILSHDRAISIFLSTGEVSGDLIGANLARQLLTLDVSVVLSGVGGDRMKNEGVRVLFNSNRLGSVGISEPLPIIPATVKCLKTIRSHIRREKPSVAVLIGNDVFHFLLSRWLRANGVFTFSYFPPQVWLWSFLSGVISSSYDQILTSFLQEEDVYKLAGASTIFVGHYLLDQIEPITPDNRRTARESLGVNSDRRILAILPGSRTHELHYVLPVLFDVVRQMKAEDSDILFILPMADACFRNEIQDRIGDSGLNSCIISTGDSREAMAASDMAILCSGTATLEAALMGLPMIILYKGSSLSWMLVRFLDATGLIESKTVGLPNLLTRQKVVPEFIQAAVVGSSIARLAWTILNDPLRQAQMIDDMKVVRRELGRPGGSERAARVILDKAKEIKCRE